MEAEELKRKRIERMEKTISGKEPDRVPIMVYSTIFNAVYGGYSIKDVYFDYEVWKSATLKVAGDFEFDYLISSIGLGGTIMLLSFVDNAPEVAVNLRHFTGPYHLILQDVFTHWPGVELDDDAHPQFVGRVVMESDEYRQLSDSPADFFHETVLPRICRNLSPERSVAERNATLARLGLEAARLGAAQRDLGMLLMNSGYPIIPTGYLYAPLDIIADFLRDFKYAMLDLYRQPDDVLGAVEALTPLLTRAALTTSSFPEAMRKVIGTNLTMCFTPLHLNEYLNHRLYNEYYWPSLLEIFRELVKHDILPLVWFEGRHDAHLETLLEAPKRKIIGIFEKTDPRKVREVLGDHVVIVTGPPNSLLIGGTPQKVESFMKSLLDDCKEGGMMVWPGVDGGISRDAKPENIRAVIDAVKKYGRY